MSNSKNKLQVQITSPKRVLCSIFSCHGTDYWTFEIKPKWLPLSHACSGVTVSCFKFLTTFIHQCTSSEPWYPVTTNRSHCDLTTAGVGPMPVGYSPISIVLTLQSIIVSSCILTIRVIPGWPGCGAIVGICDRLF